LRRQGEKFTPLKPAEAGSPDGATTNAGSSAGIFILRRQCEKFTPRKLAEAGNPDLATKKCCGSGIFCRAVLRSNGLAVKTLKQKQ